MSHVGVVRQCLCSATGKRTRTDQGRFRLHELDDFTRILIEMAPWLAQSLNLLFLVLEWHVSAGVTIFCALGSIGTS